MLGGIQTRLTKVKDGICHQWKTIMTQMNWMLCEEVVHLVVSSYYKVNGKCLFILPVWQLVCDISHGISRKCRVG